MDSRRHTRFAILLALASLTALISSACGNAVDLFGSPHHATPKDTAPPNWNPGFGIDKYFYFWRIGANQADQLKGRIWREPIDFSSPPTEFWKGSPPNYKCVGCHAVSHDGRYISMVELSSRISIDFSLHVVDLSVSTGAEVVIGSAANPMATPPAGSFSSWRPVAVGETSDKLVFVNDFGLQIASVTSGVLATLTPVTADNYAPSMPSWGSDGRIYYARSRFGDPRIVLYQESEIWSIKEDGSDNRLEFSEPGKMSYFPEISPNGRWLAFTQSPGTTQDDTTFANVKAKVFILDLQTGDKLTPNDLDAVSNEGRSWATWSAVGNRLTCGTAVAQEDANGNHDSDVYMVDFDPDTGMDFNARRVDAISTSEFEHIPRWSP